MNSRNVRGAYLADAYNKTRYIVIASSLIGASLRDGKLLLSTRSSASRQFPLVEVDRNPVGGRTDRGCAWQTLPYD